MVGGLASEGGAFENGKPKQSDGGAIPAAPDQAWAERFFAAVHSHAKSHLITLTSVGSCNAYYRAN